MVTPAAWPGCAVDGQIVGGLAEHGVLLQLAAGQD